MASTSDHSGRAMVAMNDIQAVVEITNRVNPPFAVDLLARRPDDMQRRYAQGDPLIRKPPHRHAGAINPRETVFYLDRGKPTDAYCR